MILAKNEKTLEKAKQVKLLKFKPFSVKTMAILDALKIILKT